MVRGRDACWEHCVLVDATKQKVRCNYCQREFSGGVYRMKFHLAQIKNKDIVPCSEVPIDVRDQILCILSSPKKQKNTKRVKVGRAAVANGQQNSSSASDDSQPNHGSSGQKGSTSPSLLVTRPSPSAQPAVDDGQIHKQDLADKKVAMFFFKNFVPLNAAKSPFYQEMVNAIADCGVGYKAPTYEKLRSSLLDRVKGDIHESWKKYRAEWKETGCTILCDNWSDGKTKTYVVVSVTCLKGALFLKSVDVTGRDNDANYLFELLENIVLDIGLENVVQVITDTTASFVYAGTLLMAKYNSVFWSPCASYCIDKMLEDMGKQEWVRTVLEEAKNISRYIYSHAWTLNMMRKFTGGTELTRPRITRFVTNFLSLRSIVLQEGNLKHMFSHSEWSSSICSRNSDAQAIKSLVYLERFWKYAHEAVSISEPLIKILRIVDGDMPDMGYIYDAIEKAKNKIKLYYKGIDENYVPIWDIIDQRWSMQLRSSLHAAAAFLNPSIFYGSDIKTDLRVRNGFQETISKMVATDKDKIEIAKEHPIYINGQGALGTDFSIMGRTLNAPGDWWAGYGYEIPTLQRAAIRILSQPCSSHWCRWNWSTFERIHSKKLNRLEMEKMNDLLFVHCNLWLQAIYQRKDGKFKAVVLEEIDLNSDWPTEVESSAPLLDDSWFDNLPLECSGSSLIC